MFKREATRNPIYSLFSLGLTDAVERCEAIRKPIVSYKRETEKCCLTIMYCRIMYCRIRKCGIFFFLAFDFTLLITRDVNVLIFLDFSFRYDSVHQKY